MIVCREEINAYKLRQFFEHIAREKYSLLLLTVSMPESHLFQNSTAEVLLAGNRGRTSSAGRALECTEGGCGFDHRVEPGVSNQAGNRRSSAGYSCHNNQLVTNNLDFHSGLLFQSWPPNSKHFETPGSNKYSES